MGDKRRDLQGAWGVLVNVLAALMPLSALVYALRILPEFGIIIYKEQFLAFFLTLCLALTFLTIPALARNNGERHVPWYDLVLTLLALTAGGYVALRYHVLIGELGLITDDKVIASTIGLALLLEAVRRHAGWTMVIIGLLALSYAYFGHYLSGMFETRPVRFERLVIYNFLGDGGVLGIPLYVAGTVVTAFILFGQMLFRTGGGQAISDLAFAAMGHRRGGPAKVAVVSSALFGSLSGSAAANVATTGMLTIPMMRRVGYSAPKAAAVEAVASTGGLVLPPVMAATGFIMAEFLGVPYATIALAAAIPALLFYLCVYLQVDLEAARAGIQGWDADDLPKLKPAIIAVLPVAVPFAVLLYVLFGMSWSPEASAFIAAGVTVVASLAMPRMRQTLWGYVEVLAKSGDAVVFVATMCAIAGLVVGVLGITGLGASLSQNLVEIADGNLWILLLVAAIGCIILGMGVPVTATYIILIILVGPALVQVGVNELAAHMFVFYFGTLSFLTPPVCISVFVAASIAKSDPMVTAGYALRFAVVAYLMPFIFVFNEAFLLQGDSLAIANAVIGAAAGVFLLSIGLVGFFANRLSWPLRLVAIVCGVIAMSLGSSSWPLAVAGLAVIVALYVVQRRRPAVSAEPG
ncbi:MAG: TRAP transporter fused permease subunit [Aquisalimonadaceae bacterium]